MHPPLRLTIACLLLFLSVPLLAQEITPEAEGWHIVERCVGELPYPTIPQSQWNFEGVIFSRNNEGVRAIRTDVETSYFLALEGEGSFPSVGGFSPDGRWFAYPVGDTHYSVNFLGEDAFGIEKLIVVSTDPAKITYQIDWQWPDFGVGHFPENALKRLMWLDNEHFLYQPNTFYNGGIIHAFTGEVDEWRNEAYLGALYQFSPDFSRAFYLDRSNLLEPTWELYDIEHDVTLTSLNAFSPSFRVAWLPDSSAFLMVVRENSDDEVSPLIMFDRDGKQTNRVMPTGDIRSLNVSPDGQNIVFRVGTRLHVGDVSDQVINDLCLELPNQYLPTEFVWSPDSAHLAFTYDRYPILLNVETLEMQILRYQTGEIIGWYPLE